MIFYVYPFDVQEVLNIFVRFFVFSAYHCKIPGGYVFMIFDTNVRSE